ncbi:TonB family protein [Deltaproteobacteria bacterium]|nr:TonB family protein [Deltaproteobacteria bacterium]
MAATLVMGNSDDITGFRWAPMVLLSMCLHLIVFFIIVFVTGSVPSIRQISDVVYEVDLVEMPLANLQAPDAATAVQKNENTITKKDNQTKRIPVQEKEEKPVVVAKRTVTKKEAEPQKPKVSSTQLIDRAISKIEKKVQTEDSNHVEEAISELEKKVGGIYEQGGAIGGGLNNITIRIYRMEVETLIKGNWSYPVAVQNQKKPQAIVVVKVQQDGTILEFWFKERSADAIFDQSVLKAIEKSNPLPPFPEGYIKSYEEFEINFNLKDLENT